MAGVYPQLDPATIWLEESALTLAASIHTGQRAAGPRRYVHRDPAQVVLYDGSLVARGGRFAAHDARALAAHWDAITETEGQFAAVRVTLAPPRIELVTDLLGFHQVYTCRHGDAWLVSNNVTLMRRLLGSSALDPAGVSSMLSMGWTPGDRTLEREVQAVPSAQHWTWEALSSEPRQRTYYPRSGLARLRAKRGGSNGRGGHSSPRHPWGRLADDMIETCRRFGEVYGRLRCGLTGGRDTRLLAALLTHADVDAEYYVMGPADFPDVEAAKSIAGLRGLPLEVTDQSAQSVIESWDGAARRLILQNDGLVSLMQIADFIHQPQHVVERLPLSLWGVGGEVARGNYGHPRIFLFDRGARAVKEHLTELMVSDHGGLLSTEAVALARNELHGFSEAVLGEGFDPIDLPDVFYLYERARRWAGSNERKAMPAGDRFSPFLSRAFVEAAFAMPAMRRYCEPLHFHLTKMWAPDMHRLPFLRNGWPSQRPLMVMMLWAARAAAWKVSRRLRSLSPPAEPNSLSTPFLDSPRKSFDHARWLEAKLSWLRELCLDQADSPLWDFVQRPVFEKATATGSIPEDRRRRMRGLYYVGTVFAYSGWR